MCKAMYVSGVCVCIQTIGCSSQTQVTQMLLQKYVGYVHSKNVLCSERSFRSYGPDLALLMNVAIWRACQVCLV